MAFVTVNDYTMKRRVPDEIKKRYLEKVADSTAFVRAEQLRRLFLWLGAKSLESGAPPTEYEVARGALGRPDSFDPQVDSVVRKEMSRLRTKLRDYYLHEGAGDEVEIRNHGPYTLTFEFREPSAPPMDRPAEGLCLLVLPLYVEPELASAADAFHGELQAQLASVDDVELIAQTTARQFARRSGDIRDFAAETGAAFVIEGTARNKDGAMLITLWLVDGRTGRTRRPHRLIGRDVDELSRQAARWLSLTLSRPDPFDAGDLPDR